MVRLDLWLVAARCFKTRPDAQAACAGGHAKVNDRAAVSATPVKVGDTVDVRTHGGRRILDVVGLAKRRGTAEDARALYVDRTPPAPPDPPSIAARDRGAGRPTKREARVMRRLKEEGSPE